MRRRYNNCRALGRHVAFVLILIGAGMKIAVAQQDAGYKSYLNAIKGTINAPNIGYKYRLALYNEASKKEVDAMYGVYLKRGKFFLDSSKQNLSLLSDGYFFKARPNEKDAFVYKLSALEKKMGIKSSDFDNQVMMIPDSMLLKMGRFTVIEQGSTVDVKYVMNKKGSSPLQEIHFIINKGDSKLLEIRMVIQDRGNYKKMFTLFDFDTAFDFGRVSSTRYFTVKGEKVSLVNGYRTYKLNSVL
jgi:hypothetical protein